MASLLNEIMNQNLKNQQMLEAICQKLGITMEEKPTRLNRELAESEILSALGSSTHPLHTLSIVEIISQRLDFRVSESSIQKYCRELAKVGKIANIREGIYQVKHSSQLDIVDAVKEAEANDNQEAA